MSDSLKEVRNIFIYLSIMLQTYFMFYVCVLSRGHKSTTAEKSLALIMLNKCSRGTSSSQVTAKDC